MYDEEKIRENFANMRTEVLIDIVKNSRNNFYEKSYLIAVDELKKRTEYGYVDKLLMKLEAENNDNIDSIKSFNNEIIEDFTLDNIVTSSGAGNVERNGIGKPAHNGGNMPNMGKNRFENEAPNLGGKTEKFGGRERPKNDLENI